MSGQEVRNIGNAEMREIIARVIGEKYGSERAIAIEQLPKSTYTSIEWTVTYADAAKSIWTEVLPHMLLMGAKHGYGNVRMVMDFDS